MTQAEIIAKPRQRWMWAFAWLISLAGLMQEGTGLSLQMIYGELTGTYTLIRLLFILLFSTALWVFSVALFGKSHSRFSDKGYEFEERFLGWKRYTQHGFTDIVSLSISRPFRKADGYRIVLCLGDNKRANVAGEWTYDQLRAIRELIEANRPGSDCPLP